MTEDSNDKGFSRKKLPVQQNEQLRSLLEDKVLGRFREQLPEDFISDAAEGLKDLPDTQQLESVLKQLNQDLHKQLGNKKSIRKRRSIADMSWTYWAIIIILLLAILGYLLISLKLKA